MMEIVYRKLSDIKPNPKNPRKGSPEAVQKLAESIKANPKFFEARPVLLSDRTGELVIIGGERRSEAAALAGLKKVPTILMTGLTEEQEDEIMVRDNTHTGEWDAAALSKIAAQWGSDTVQGWGGRKTSNGIAPNSSRKPSLNWQVLARKRRLPKYSTRRGSLPARE